MLYFGLIAAIIEQFLKYASKTDTDINICLHKNN